MGKEWPTRQDKRQGPQLSWYKRSQEGNREVKKRTTHSGKWTAKKPRPFETAGRYRSRKQRTRAAGDQAVASVNPERQAALKLVPTLDFIESCLDQWINQIGSKRRCGANSCQPGQAGTRQHGWCCRRCDVWVLSVDDWDWYFTCWKRSRSKNQWDSVRTILNQQSS